MNDFLHAMKQAVSSTRALNPAEATQVIQQALAGRSAFGARASIEPDTVHAPPLHGSKPFAIDPDAEIVESGAQPATKTIEQPDSVATSQRLRRPLGEVLRILREAQTSAGAVGSISGMSLPGMTIKRDIAPTVVDGAQFLTRSYSCAAGTRNYKLYIPASAQNQPSGLILMLHGCKQDPDDFASGTGMNSVAEAHGLLVAYPHQAGAHNASSCWNWFRPGDQERCFGEPSIIAGITAELMSEFDLDHRQVFVAGLSAGGAMAAVMGETYPDLFSAVGIHSGLAYGSANDVISAFSVMRGDSSFKSCPKPGGHSSAQVRTIVFQGGADRTVHPSNADRIVAAATRSAAANKQHRQTGRSINGRSYKKTIFTNPRGQRISEYWLIDGAGHAWSGGNASGSYTDPQGPNASFEMVRFFLENAV